MFSVHTTLDKIKNATLFFMVMPTVHTNPLQKRSFSENTLQGSRNDLFYWPCFRLMDILDAGLVFLSHSPLRSGDRLGRTRSRKLKTSEKAHGLF